MMVEEEADTSIKTRRNGVLRLKAQGDMGIDRRGDDNVPRVFNRVVAMAEHEPEPKFPAITEAEVADDEQWPVKITINAVDIAHPWSISRLYARQPIDLKADPSFGMLAYRRKGG